MTIKIGLLLDNTYTSKYVYNIIKWADERNDIDVSHFIIHKTSNTDISFLSKIIKHIIHKGIIEIPKLICWRILIKLESILLKKSYFFDHLKIFDLSYLNKQIVYIYPEKIKKDNVLRFEKNEINKIKSLNLELLIRCGSGILRGEVLKINKFGILSFHHGDNRKYRGGPAGFWEVYNHEKSTGFIIQQLTNELDAGKIIYRGNFITKKHYLLNQAHLYTKSNYYMKLVLLDLAKNNKLTEFKNESCNNLGKIYKTPSFLVQLKYLFNLIFRKISAKFKKRIEWKVSYTKGNWKNILIDKNIEISNPKNSFLADPFIYSHKGKDYCFVEEFNYLNLKGSISLYEFKNNSAIKIGNVLKEKFHLSFPYLFEYENKIFMVPESSENRDIRLYEATNFPLEWKLNKIIFNNVKAVDTMIFKKDNHWWLFTNIDPSDIGDNCSELFIYYSDNPINDSWISHKLNPVLVDSNIARNGGILYDNNNILRIGQKQGFDKYGLGYSVNKIITLNPYEYKEEKIYEFESDSKSRKQGPHHLHSNAKITVFDFYK